MSDVFHSVYRELSVEEKQLMAKIKESAEELYTLFDELAQGRETALAKTKLEESVMWAVKGLTK